MNNVSFLNVFSGKNDQIEYKCPSCGNICNEKNKKCSVCGYGLKEFKSIILSKYNYFNNSLDYITKKDYFNALLEITRFLTFLPNDEKGNELFVYLLYKNGKDDDYKKQLDLFEQKFSCSSFIMNVENEGIEKYKIPPKIDIDIEFDEDSFEKLINLYETNRYRSINDILELSQGFFEIMQAIKEKNKEKIVQDFYNKRFMQFLSKQEISIEYSDGKNYESLSDDDKKKIDIKGHIEAKKPVNTIVTLSPAFYVRSKLIAREQAFVVNKSKRW